MSTSQPIVRRATAEEVWPLRHAVLRAGLPFDTAMFDGDLDDTTRHFGTFAGRNVLCCLSFFILPVFAIPAEDGDLFLPPGCKSSVIAENLGKARGIAVCDNGDIYVSLLKAVV